MINLLMQYKSYLIGGSIIIALLLLANHLENNGIRQEVASKYEEAIRNAKPRETFRDTILISSPEIKGEAKSNRMFQYKRLQFDSLAPLHIVTRDSLIDSLDYYRWLLNEYTTKVADSSGVELEMTAKPRESSISYVLKLPDKEQINTHIENQVLIPPNEKNWTFGLEAGYFNEARLGVGIGVKPISLWADYFPQSTENKWGGHLQFTVEF